MNLVIDIGNSRTKLAVFDKEDLVHLFVSEDDTLDYPSNELHAFPLIDQVILSSVRALPEDFLRTLENHYNNIIRLSHATPSPISNGYKTPETLGLDRLAAAAGAQGIFPGKDILVIDAGTAITFDLVEKEGTFRGGNISPGLLSRFRALNQFTGRLPLVEAGEYWPFIGQTTEEAIRSGVVQGMLFEIEGMIAEMQNRYPGIQVILTGGDAAFFERRLKSTIFVKFEITLIGLNRILTYNAEKKIS